MYPRIMEQLKLLNSTSQDLLAKSNTRETNHYNIDTMSNHSWPSITNLVLETSGKDDTNVDTNTNNPDNASELSEELG